LGVPDELGLDRYSVDSNLAVLLAAPINKIR
jgi:hypothetical protein